jgi:sulfur carrier protein ThiS
MFSFVQYANSKNIFIRWNFLFHEATVEIENSIFHLMKIFIIARNENIYYRSKWKYLLSLEMKIFIIARNENIYYRSKWKYLLSLEIKIFIIARNENIYYRSKWKYLSLETSTFSLYFSGSCIPINPKLSCSFLLQYICTYTGTDRSRL